MFFCFYYKLLSKTSQTIYNVTMLMAFTYSNQRELSKDRPMRSNETTILTTGSFLTIKGFRDVKNSKNYTVEMTIKAVSKCPKLFK